LTLRPSPILNIFVSKFAKSSYLIVVVAPDYLAGSMSP
jgi:hypothetical protein